MVRRPGFLLFVAPGSHSPLQSPLGCGRFGSMDDTLLDDVFEAGWITADKSAAHIAEAVSKFRASRAV